MKLFAENLFEQLEVFLHAGYLSAYPPQPSTVDSSVYPTNAELIHELDLVEALRLESAADTIAPAPDAAQGMIQTAGLTASGFVTTAAVFFGILALLYILRNRIKTSAYTMATAATLSLAVLLFVPHCETEPDDPLDNNDDPKTEPENNGKTGTDPTGGSGTEPSGGIKTEPTEPDKPDLPTNKPWDEVEPRTYANPKDATIAILHGIIIPAVANIGRRVTSLANIQNHVGLPTDSPTDGMEYALKTYGLDGWGREFLFLGNVIKSAGPDGEFYTEDDIKVPTVRFDDYDFGRKRTAFYLVKYQEKLGVFFHIWHGALFEYTNQSWANEVTGNEPFDVWLEKDIWSDTFNAIENSYDRFASGADHSPIVLQVFDQEAYL